MHHCRISGKSGSDLMHISTRSHYYKNDFLQRKSTLSMIAFLLEDMLSS
jgi:hypothetical protein